MPGVMEAFLWVWVTRLLQPFNGVGQPHKVTVFDWTDTHWNQMEKRPDAVAAAQATDEAKKAEDQEKQDQAAAMRISVKRQENKDIGTFEL